MDFILGSVANYSYITPTLSSLISLLLGHNEGKNLWSKRIPKQSLKCSTKGGCGRREPYGEPA